MNNNVEWTKLVTRNLKFNDFMSAVEWMEFIQRSIDIVFSVGGVDNVAFYFVKSKNVYYCIGAPNGDFSRYDIDSAHVDKWELEEAKKYTLDQMMRFAAALVSDAREMNKI